jgi:hypothetical protein
MRESQIVNNMMRQRLMTILSAVSLVMCLATAGLWVRSYWRTDVIQFSTATSGFEFGAGRGELGFVLVLHKPAAKISPPRFLWEVKKSYFLLSQRVPGTIMRAFGSAIIHNPPRSAGTSVWAVALPCWFAMSLTALPVVSLIRNRLRRSALRLRLNLCVKCGYDLRATPDRCPECGRAQHIGNNA